MHHTLPDRCLCLCVYDVMACVAIGQARVVMFGGTLEAGSLDEGTMEYDVLYPYVCVYDVYM